MDADGRTNGEFSTLLDPGCDPGPVHVHGLTAQRLKGAPEFPDVAQRVSDMLVGRVLVAHNAPFDYGFLAEEFRRANARLPVERRLCTLALNRRLSPATPDLKLATLAAHYGVRQRVAHDALEDVRTLTGVLRGSLAEAARLGLSLPLVACPPKQQGATWQRIPKTRCAYRCPGPLRGELVQGMKVAITGETDVPGEQLVERAVAAGLNVMTSVSRHTSVLVTNDVSSGSAKARRALAEGVPVVDERTFLKLLDNVRAGTLHGTPKQPTPAMAPSGSGTPETPEPPEARGPDDGERALAQATLDAGTSERTMLLAEFYRRGGGWRLRMVGQGYDFGLDALAQGFGVDIDG
ncbi:hypothetical protein GCM10022254_37790 [Actinomadura meridiana]|uniref:DNA polymerase III n=2 Tax=Actinomadura meridiana TaxID=559626 RepID=A0ABP8C624_9ACTN